MLNYAITKPILFEVIQKYLFILVSTQEKKKKPSPHKHFENLLKV